METIVGMCLVLVAIGGIAVGLVGIIGVALTIPDALRVWWALRTPPVPVAKRPEEGRVKIQGLVATTEDLSLEALTDQRDIVVRHLVVFEQVGKNSPERHNSTELVRFVVEDASGLVVVNGDSAKLLSPTVLGGAVGAAVADYVGPVFAWPKTPKHYFESVVAPGDFVTLTGDSLGEAGIGGPLTIMVGEPRFWASEEVKMLLWSLLAVPGGAVMSVGGYFALMWWVD